MLASAEAAVGIPRSPSATAVDEILNSEEEKPAETAARQHSDKEVTLNKAMDYSFKSFVGSPEVNYPHHYYPLGSSLGSYPALDLRGSSAAAFYGRFESTVAAGGGTSSDMADNEKPPLLRLADGNNYWSEHYSRLEERKMSTAASGGGDLYSPLSYPLPAHHPPEALYGANYHGGGGGGGCRSYSGYSSQYQEYGGAVNLNINVNLNIHPSGIVTKILLFTRFIKARVREIQNSYSVSWHSRISGEICIRNNWM
jgi:hypothetical protein